MFVLVDIEWSTNTQGDKSPTQLAALKVDEQWNVTDSFDSFIRPRDESFHNWKHVSYRGGDAKSFLHARNAHAVFTDFLSWLDDDDVLLWWFDESPVVFCDLVGKILRSNDEHRFVIISDYVHEYLAGQENSHGNAYKLAEARGINTNSKMNHCSANDVSVLQSLMKIIGYPQEWLLQPLVRKETKAAVQKDRAAHLCYRYDPSANMLHHRDCDKYDHADESIKGYPNFTAAIKKGYMLCSCCEREYLLELKERNQRIINKMNYTYIYSPESDIVHRYDCSLMLSARSIMGTKHYKTISKMGLIPCEVCNPTRSEVHIQISQYEKEKQIMDEVIQSPASDVSKAIRRQKTAVQDRERLLENNDLTQQEMDDIYTLTQPRFAFWAARGYTTFHQRYCPKLNDISELKGFSTFSDATRAGFRPCRHCKPSAKQDLTLSIPITSKQRNNERIEDLEPLCRAAEYTFRYEQQYFCLETPAGKWRIDMQSAPIKLKHINLVKSPNEVDYHDQPRLFLSFVDVFEYIKRHDEDLMRKIDFVEDGEHL